jgi:hypothetical protein
MDEANEMLAEFLRKTRTLRRKGGGSRGLDSRKLDMVSHFLQWCTDISGYRYNFGKATRQ